MLLNITIENFRSYNEAQTLSLIASENNGVNSAKVGDLEVRKSAVIYGANASGKSNFLKGLNLFVALLTRDISQVMYEPFFGNSKPVSISFDFEFAGKVLSYQFAFDAEKIHSESLLDDKEKLIFRRSLVKSGGYRLTIPQAEVLLDKKQLLVKSQIIDGWKLSTYQNQLFLRRCAESGSVFLKKIVEYLQKSIVFRQDPYMQNHPSTLVGMDLIGASNAYLQDQDWFMQNMHSIGASFENIEFRDNKITLANGQEHMAREVIFNYRYNDKDIKFGLGNESDGTLKFFNYLGLIRYTIENNAILVVDELETHFHPLMVEEIIRAVHNSNSKAQLIFTTHNPTFLTESIFERDQIYFAEKNDKLATELYSLADFSDLTADSNLMAKYLSGNFGAIPHLNSFNFSGGKNG